MNIDNKINELKTKANNKKDNDDYDHYKINIVCDFMERCGYLKYMLDESLYNIKSKDWGSSYIKLMLDEHKCINPSEGFVPAIRATNDKIFKVLLENGADPNYITTRYGYGDSPMTILDYALYENILNPRIESIVRELMKYGAKTINEVLTQEEQNRLWSKNYDSRMH